MAVTADRAAPGEDAAGFPFRFGLRLVSLQAIPLPGHADDVVVEVKLLHLRPEHFHGQHRCLNVT
jgi:hypothetical protein